jgi:AhpD family alkylhydroperoxidase
VLWQISRQSWNALDEHQVDHDRTVELDPLTKELIYIAMSTTNSCSYCVHSHTASARAKGLSDAQYSEFLALISMASETNALANALQIPVDPEFLAG